MTLEGSSPGVSDLRVPDRGCHSPDIITDEEETDYSTRNAGIAVTVIGLAMAGAGVGMLVGTQAPSGSPARHRPHRPSFTPGGVGLQTQLRF